MSSSTSSARDGSAIWQWRPERPAYAVQPAQLIRLDGEDSRRVLHGQTTAAVETAQPGQWIGTCSITATGRMRAVAEVLVDGDGAWLVVTSGDGAQVHAALDRVLFPADRVRLGAPQPAWWLTPVAAADEAWASGPSPVAGHWQPLPDGQGWQLRASEAGAAGLQPPPELGAALLLRATTAAAAPDPAALPSAWAGRQPLSALEQERWRLQQGLPAAPAELNDDHNPFELGLAGRVRLNKGCYVGQETLAKLATYDGVKQQLRRWHWRPQGQEQPPACGDTLRASGADGEPTRLGRITSRLALPDGTCIGLALVRRAGLDQAQLLAGSATVSLSVPEQVVAPPVGAGGGR